MDILPNGKRILLALELIAKSQRMGNFSLLKGIADSDGIIGIRGNRTISSPLNYSVNRKSNVYRCIIEVYSNYAEEY